MRYVTTVLMAIFSTAGSVPVVKRPPSHLEVRSEESQRLPERTISHGGTEITEKTKT